MSRKTDAFTLVELLVVIAVVGILAAILFPVFSKAKKRALTASDMVSIKQIGEGIHAYTADYDDLLPYASNAITKELILSGAHHALSDRILEAPNPTELLIEYGVAKPLWKSSEDCLLSYGTFTDTWNCSSSFFQTYGSSYFYDENTALQLKTYTGDEPSRCVLASDTEPFRSQNEIRWKILVLYGDGHAKIVPWEVGTNQFCNWIGIYP